MSETKKLVPHNGPDLRPFWGNLYIQYHDNGQVKIHPEHKLPYVDTIEPSQALKKACQGQPIGPDTRVVPHKLMPDSKAQLDYLDNGHKVNFSAKTRAICLSVTH